MQAVLWSMQKRLNSTMQPDTELGDTVEVKIKADCDMLNPVLLMHRYNIFITEENRRINYLLLNGKYYWITNVVFKDNDLVEVYCAIDVLASYRDVIREQTAYVERCSQFADGYITDGYYPITNRISSFSGKTMTTNPFYDPEALSVYYRFKGFYSVGLLLGRLTDESMIFPTAIAQRGAVTFIAMTQVQLERFIAQLNEVRFYLADFNPIQYIVSCTFIPSSISMTNAYFNFDLLETLGSQQGSEVQYSVLDENSYDYASNGIIDVSNGVLTFGTIPNLTNYGNSAFRYFEPFSKYQFNAGPFGLIDIPSACITLASNTQQQLIARCLYTIKCDATNGQGILSFSNSNREIMRIEGYVGVQVKLSQTSSSSLTGVLNTISSALQIPSNPISGTVNTLSNAISNATPRVQSMGTNESFLSYTQWSINAVSYDVKTYNNDNVGYPLGTNMSFSLLNTGAYVQCKNVHINNILDATRTEIEMIEEYMNTGFYWE